jgi:hypothetical protein
MKKYIVLSAFLFIAPASFLYCSAQTTQTKSVTYSLRAKAHKLKRLYAEMISDSSNSYSQLQFFDAFPNNFTELNELYGDNSNPPAILSNEAEQHIFKFNGLDKINDTVYYKKIISIAIGGHWDADAINYFQNGLIAKVEADPTLIIYLLQSMSDKQIRGFCYFYFDGVFPITKIPDDLLFTKRTNPRIYKLMKVAIKEVNAASKQ